MKSRNGCFIGTTTAVERVYATRDAIVTKPRRKPPWHTTIVFLLVELHTISPTDSKATEVASVSSGILRPGPPPHRGRGRPRRSVPHR